MRSLGVGLLFFGLVAFVVGLFSGCNALFSFNGRHAIDLKPLAGEGRTIESLSPTPGRRYTLAVQVVFDRDGLAKNEGTTVITAQMPLVVQVRDRAGTKLANVTGWLDPNEPPNVLYGQNAQDSSRGATTAELTVERLVGPFTAASSDPLAVEVVLGADRIGKAVVKERRLAIYDDALPGSIRSAFFAAAAGGLALGAGLVITLFGFFRRRRRAARPRNAAT